MTRLETVCWTARCRARAAAGLLRRSGRIPGDDRTRTSDRPPSCGRLRFGGGGPHGPPRMPGQPAPGGLSLPGGHAQLPLRTQVPRRGAQAGLRRHRLPGRAGCEAHRGGLQLGRRRRSAPTPGRLLHPHHRRGHARGLGGRAGDAQRGGSGSWPPRRRCGRTPTRGPCRPWMRDWRSSPWPARGWLP